MHPGSGNFRTTFFTIVIIGALPMNQQVDTDAIHRALAANATHETPVVALEGKASFPDALVKSVGLDAKSSLKAALWRTPLQASVTNPDPRFLSLVHHCAGGPVWTSREPEVKAVAGSATLQDWREPQEWNSDDVVTFGHYYLATDLIRDIAESLFDIEFKLDDLQRFTNAHDKSMINLMNAANASVFGEDDVGRLALDGWALLFSETLLRYFSRYGDKPRADKFGKLPPKSIRLTVDFIEEHLDQDLSLDVLANVAAMSPYHFSRRFKETVGMAPHAYVMYRRAHKAKNLLIDSGLCLAQIAYDCGFASQSHMTTTVKKVLGITPARLRKEANRMMS